MPTPSIKGSERRNNPPLSTTLNDGWRYYGGSGIASYASATTFTLAGDHTADFTFGRKVRIYHATAAAYKYAMVVSSSYSAPNTTVVVSGDTLLNQTYSSIWLDISPVGYAQQPIQIGNPGEFLVADSSGLPNYIPDGRAGMINGKIVTSVASNNLTVAIKGLDGNDPSTTNPVYVRIGNTIRAITAALSVTKNAGTDWFGSGSGGLQTQEVDYFCYLIWNTTPATDIVDIGFARISSGVLYSDFSGTSTNAKYLASGNASAPTSTDEVQVVGRFNAILSATASFNWSIPATSVIIQHPIYDTRELSWVPVWTGLTGTPTVTFAKYQKIKNITHCIMRIAANATMTATGTPTFTVPNAAKAATFVQDIGPVWVTYGADNYLCNMQINGGVTMAIYVITLSGNSHVLFGQFGIGNAVGFPNTIEFWYLSE